MKQPFNLSQEKIDQLFRHCIFDLTPKAIGNKYMYYHTSDNAYRYRIQGLKKMIDLIILIHVAILQKIFLNQIT